MTTITELTAALESATPTTEMAAENAIAVYLAAKSQMNAYQAVADAAKARLTEIIEETGQVKWMTKAGAANVTAPSVSTSYDAKALDALSASDDSLARLLAPHRKQSE